VGRNTTWSVRAHVRTLHCNINLHWRQPAACSVRSAHIMELELSTFDHARARKRKRRATVYEESRVQQRESGRIRKSLKLTSET